jgi:hypothetical protein
MSLEREYKPVWWKSLDKLWYNSAVFRFFIYLPVGWLVAFLVVTFCYEALDWEWLKFAYPRKMEWQPSRGGHRLTTEYDLLNFGLLVFSILFTALWVWRKPFVVKPVRWLDKKAEEE